MKIIIEVEGGLVQSVYTDSKEDIEVGILDHDIVQNGDYDEDELENCKELERQIKTMKVIY